MNMATSNRCAGFSLLEIVVAIAILAVVAGAVLPLGSGQRRTDQTAKVRAKLARIEASLLAYRRNRGVFPTNLDDATFLGPYLAPGVGNDAIRDDWNNGAIFQFQVVNGVAWAWSVGPIRSSAPGSLQSYSIAADPNELNFVSQDFMRARLREIVTTCWTRFSAYQRYRYTSSYIGPYSFSYSRLRFSSTYSNDIWGTRLRGHYYGFTMGSAGPDRIWGTADDITEAMP
jgi:prepilin-type N-terminal cleavage/methylation domain-containing protein